MDQPTTHAGASRMFTRYRAEPDANGGMVLREDFRERDRDSGRYFDKTVTTSIRLAAGCTLEDATAITMAAGVIREELDATGVKLYFDRPKADPVNLYPKWKYKFGGQFKEIPIDRASIDADVMALVERGPDFYREATYKKWYGRKMQYVREGIVLEALAAAYRDKLMPQDPEKGAKASEPAPSEPITPELQHGITMLVDDMAHLYEMPAQAEKLVSRVTQFSRGLFEYQFAPSGAKPRPTVAPETLHAAVLRAVERKFADDAAVRDALRGLSGKKIVLDRISPSA